MPIPGDYVAPEDIIQRRWDEVAEADRVVIVGQANSGANFDYQWSGSNLIKIIKNTGSGSFYKDLTWSGSNLVHITDWISM